MRGDSGYAYLPAGQAEVEFGKYEERIKQLEKLNATLAAEIDRLNQLGLALEIVATYTHGTNRFWCYEHNSDEGIFKFWMPHTEKVGDRYQSLRPPEMMDLRIRFERDRD